MDFLARLRVIALARDIDERRYKSVITVVAQKDANLRTLRQAQRAHRRRKNLVFLGLEKFLARVGVENMSERLSVMAVRRQAGAM